MSFDGLFELEKSRIDHRSYRYIELNNGLKALLVSNLKPGEDVPEESLSDSDVESDGSESLEEEDINMEEKYISDREAKSAAALCIKVGSFSDPLEAQGLSHFLEHMVFMGSLKYPTENDFDAYLSQRGGTNNAWTGNEYTLFHFDVKRKHFADCLDKFANFFISPLLSKDSTDREINAVNSEFELAYTKDSSRLHYLIGHLSRKDSPYKIFGYGNCKSLREIPEQRGTDIYSLLDKHRKNFYSADRMTLAVQSKHRLDDLEVLVRKIFCDIPKIGLSMKNFQCMEPFDINSFAKLYKVCPLSIKEKLRIVWILPPQVDHYESSPMEVLSSLIGHEGRGSVLALLKKENLAVSLGAGVSCTSDFENSSLCTIFMVNIQLTDYGRDNIFRVCGILFNYIKILLHSALTSISTSLMNGSVCNNGEAHENHFQRQHTFATYLPEYQMVKTANFLFTEPDEAEDTVVNLANMLHLVKPEHVYSGYRLLKEPNIQLYIDLLKLMTPNRAAIFFLSSTFSSSLKDESQLEHEPWFNVAYQTEAIPEHIMNEWMHSKPNDADQQLHLPYENKFLTTDFNLLDSKDDMKQPVDLNLEPGAESRLKYGHLWFQQSTRFKCPKASVMIHLWSDVVSKTKENMALHTLMVYGLNQSLSTITYEASEADLIHDLAFRDNGLRICVSGFSEKLFCFYSTILDHILDHSEDLSKEYFESYRDAVRQIYYNEALKPSVLNTHLQFYLLRKEAYLIADLLSALKKLSVANLAAYKQRFLSTLHITIYAYGNIKKLDAINFFDYTVKKIQPIPIPTRKLIDASILDPGTYYLRVMNCNPNDVNMCLARIHLLGESDIKRQCYNKLLAFILSEPAFDYLRTKESLGYTVYLRYWRSSPGGTQHSGISLVACSPANKFSIDHVAGRITAFWRQLAPRIIAAMPSEAFKTSVESLISVHQLEDPNMMTEFERNWDEIMEGTANFNYREECVKILSTITQESLLNFFLTEYLDNKKQRSLFVQVDATTNPELNSNTVSNSYNLNLDIIDTNLETLKAEYSSLNDIDIVNALMTCGYDEKQAEEFIHHEHIVEHRFLEGSRNEQEEEMKSTVFINNLFKFRSTIQYQIGREV
ncbi:Nardilysin isoform 2 [Schistosoma japonicum]|uniref:Nardilysin isoform 2 n=2 Tax=Schistosoma japonicum TaxID=6182 RepID=A0A4Z2CVB1_SCHJA|nr:Nardilysin isoform 2 [Schistosoma japonicum]